MGKIDDSSTDAKRRIPKEQISVSISPAEKQQLEELAKAKDLSLSAMCRRAIQAYLYAVNSRKRKVKSIKNA